MSEAKITIRTTEGLRAELARYCEREGISQSRAVEEAIEMMLTQDVVARQARELEAEMRAKKAKKRGLFGRWKK